MRFNSESKEDVVWTTLGNECRPFAKMRMSISETGNKDKKRSGQAEPCLKLLEKVK